MSQPRPGLPAKQIAAVVAGNALEFYDFLTYAFFATQIAHAFYPDYSPARGLLLTLATFGAGFLTRPLGAWIIGGMGDRLGRKPAMILSFALMGVALFGLALTPSYRSIGIAAPIIALGFRMLQGFALGGNVGPTTAYLIEAAPEGRRGFYASLSFASQDFSVMVAGIVGTALSYLLSPVHFNEYGWRIAFLLGASIVPFGLMLRRTLTETHDPAVDRDAPPLPLLPYLPVALFGLVLLASATISNYVLDYMTTYANDTLHMNTKAAFGATIVLGLFQVSADLVSGWLSDRYGRKRVMIIPTALMLLLALPAFFVIAYFRTAAALFAATAVLAALQGLGSSPILIWITESIPARIRSGAVSVIYAVSIAIFGGTTQATVKFLLDWTHNPLMPAWYASAALAAGLIAMVLIRESAPPRARTAQ
ncbi:MAG TPA: MFS transporter [Rhizomicrobium sp.]|jgi:MFS family permease